MRMTPNLNQIPEVPQQLCKLPRYRPMAKRIQQDLDGRAEFGAIKRLVSLDPAMAVELLVAANSPIYGFPLKIHTVHESLVLLGWEHAKRILRAALRVAQPADDQRDRLIEAAWVHSIAAAHFAAGLAPYFGLAEDRAWALGLLHDIGKLGLLSASPAKYLDVVALRNRTPAECLGSEEYKLGMNHSKAGLWLARVWGLPADFAEAAGMHHEPVFRVRQQAGLLAGIACRLADANGFAVEEYRRTSSREALACASPEMAQQLEPALGAIEQKSRESLLECFQVFRGVAAEDSVEVSG